ncbi:adenylate/guanylate cyclase domain-containing protein [Pseudomonadota bacterium]
MIKSKTFVWNFDCKPAELWPLIADTARFNEAIKFPKHQIQEILKTDGSVQYLAQTKLGLFKLDWDDLPQNWVIDEWFEHRRNFLNGPFKNLNAIFEIKPQENGCIGKYTVSFESADLLGRLLLAGPTFRRMETLLNKQIASVKSYLENNSDTVFDIRPPIIDAEVRARAQRIAEFIEQSPHSHGLANKLVTYLFTSPEVDLWSIRPLKLARVWGVNKRHAIELCLEATKQGLLNLRWDLLCPRCQVGKTSVASLKELPQGSHCAACNIDFNREFSKNVELVFHPNPSIRPVEKGEYCLLGPMSTPHIKVQLTLAPGESKSIDMVLAENPYRIRTLEAGGEQVIDWVESDTGFHRIKVLDQQITLGEPGAKGTLLLTNEGALQRTLIIEEFQWMKDALTAHRATALQAFRDLFDTDVLRPGDDAEIESITIMFTDLKGSTALYDNIGDPQAYSLVREHFLILGKAVTENNGSIVKMIGDAIMAVFVDPADCLRCGFQIHHDIGSFNDHSEKPPIVLKLGMHSGRCISVTMNDRLDYYGSTANMAARLQAQSLGGDIVLSMGLSEDPAISEILSNFSPVTASCELKGFSEPVTYIRLTNKDVTAAGIPTS